MGREREAGLKTAEIKLLERRTALREEFDRLLGAEGWDADEAARLGREQDRIERELAETRRELGRLSRGD